MLYFNNHVANYKINNPDDPDLTNGLQQKEIFLTSAGDTVKQVETYYKDLLPSLVSYTGMKIYSNFIGLDQCNPPLTTNPWPEHKYQIDFYPISSRWMVPAQKITTLYDGPRRLVTVDSSFYNTIGQKTSEVNYDSRGQKRSSLTQYPYDTTGTMAQLLKDSLLFNFALQQRSLTGASETEKITNSYGIQNSQVVLTDTKHSYRGGPLSTDVAYTHYDTYRALDEVIQKGIATVLVWSNDKCYVLAECVNADHNDVAYTSFEPKADGNWTIDSSARDTITAAVTGWQSYNLSLGSITKSNLTSGSHYILSYWSTTGAKSVSGATGSATRGRTAEGWTYFEHLLTATGTTLTISGSGNIDELRLHPQGSQMTTFTHLPLVGIVSKGDPNNHFTYYDYDAHGRLISEADYNHDIMKTYQYNMVNRCGDSCYTMELKNLIGTPTLSYPVGVFNIKGKLLGNAASQSDYVTTWMSDTTDSNTGTLSAGYDSLHFNIRLAAGRSLPAAITGARYYQFDYNGTKLSIKESNGSYINFGDGVSFSILHDKPLAPYPGYTSTAYTTGTVVQTIYSTPDYYVFNVFKHTYSDTSSKTVTVYHSDGAEDFDYGYFSDAYPQKATNLRGNYPEHMVNFKPYQFAAPSALSVSAVTNWNKIHTVEEFGTGADNYASYPTFAQDFMAANRRLNYVSKTYRYDTLHISRLKSDWNTYFTSLASLGVQCANWNYEDLSGLKQLSNVLVSDYYAAATPITSAQIDAIINQIAAGAGQYVDNGSITIAIRGAAVRTSASDAAVTYLQGKNWFIQVSHY